MPAFAEMLVSQSPPTYNHSLADYISNHATTRSYCRPASLQLTPPPLRRQLTPPSPLSGSTSPSKMPASPRRSCLVVRPEDLSPEDERVIDLRKKKVVFADDQGGQLTHVRVMKEPSYMPPIWSLQFLAHVTQGMISPVPQEQWVVDFRQPASAYLEFRQKVEEKNVSLENVIIKETEHLIVGTVKVKNVSYNKEVIVRSSCDAWKSHEDTYCTYTVVGSGAASAYTMLDTFSFKLTLPPKSRRIEFCVCYKCDIGEFWDNNDDHNYSLTNRVMPRQESSIFFPPHSAFSNNNNHSNNSTNNSTNGPSSVNNTTTSTSLSSNMFNSPYVDPTAELDTWRHMSAVNHTGPYCLDVSPFHIEDVLKPTPEPFDQQKRCAQDLVDTLTKNKSIIPPPVRKSTSCSDEFAAARNTRSGSYPRDTGRRYLIRERKEGDDLLANLLNLRELMLNQNVHA